jgi:periplasmic protein TonB
MVNRIAFRSVVLMTASALIHAGLVAAIVLGRDWAPAAAPVLIAELVEPETPPAVEPPAPLVPKRRPVTPPRPVATPLPFEAPTPPEPSTHLPEPPAGIAHEPPRSVAPPPPVLLPPEPAAEPGRVPEAPRPAVGEPPRTPAPPAAVASPGAVSTPAASATVDPGPGTFPATAPAPRSSVAVAAIPADGVTRRAIPRGGYQYRPAYPSRARRLGIQGTTLLHVLVSEHGRVAEVIVKQSAGHPDLDQAAADAVRRWQFEPARSGDAPVEMWVQLPFEFRLR